MLFVSVRTLFSLTNLIYHIIALFVYKFVMQLKLFIFIVLIQDLVLAKPVA